MGENMNKEQADVYKAVGCLIGCVAGLLVITEYNGYILDRKIRRLSEQSIELNQNLSNIIQRVNFYHGTNWNYNPQKNLTNGVVEDRKWLINII